LAFSPDGRILASGSYDKSIILWDMVTHQPIGQPLTGHTDYINSVAFSPDGKTLASGSDDHTVMLWDVASHQPLGMALKGQTDVINIVAFSPSDRTLASGSSDGTIVLWDVDPQFWMISTCQRAGRNFSRAEWAQYLPSQPYPAKQEEAACSQWPLEPEPTPTANP
jgi:WD40 repeat protein